MKKETKTRLRRLNTATHRDLGYFFSSLIVVYCISGLALNHIDDWNPDFMISKSTVHIKGNFSTDNISDQDITFFNGLVGEESYKIYDTPTSDQVKIYYDNASLHLNFSTHEGLYEKVARRPLFYHSNVLHRNSVKGWKWVSDVFAIMLILISITGLFVLKGKHGIAGRGKWFIAAGFLPPLIALIIHEIS